MVGSFYLHCLVYLRLPFRQVWGLVHPKTGLNPQWPVHCPFQGGNLLGNLYTCLCSPFYNKPSKKSPQKTFLTTLFHFLCVCFVCFSLQWCIDWLKQQYSIVLCFCLIVLLWSSYSASVFDFLFPLKLFTPCLFGFLNYYTPPPPF